MAEKQMKVLLELLEDLIDAAEVRNNLLTEQNTILDRIEQKLTQAPGHV